MELIFVRHAEPNYAKDGLTEKGKKAFFHHRDFHKRMIRSIVKDLEEDEMKVLIRCLQNLTKFFGEQNDK